MGYVYLASGKVGFYFPVPFVLCIHIPQETTKLEVRDGGGGEEDEGQCLLKPRRNSGLPVLLCVAMPLSYLSF